MKRNISKGKINNKGENKGSLRNKDIKMVRRKEVPDREGMVQGLYN